VLVAVVGLGAYVYAQTPSEQRLSLSFVADIITTVPVNGYDGIVRIGRADNVLTASGNVVILVNRTRLTADAATWHWGAREIELNGGIVRVELPNRPTSISIGRAR
jgi:lipopolysaccharide assembly outer membrane protein LptD (OstA)